MLRCVHVFVFFVVRVCLLVGCLVFRLLVGLDVFQLLGFCSLVWMFLLLFLVSCCFFSGYSCSFGLGVGFGVWGSSSPLVLLPNVFK